LLFTPPAPTPLYTLSLHDALPIFTPILSSRNGFDLTPIKPLPPIISGHDLLHQELALPDELVQGMIHRGTQTLVAGCSKSYKTRSEEHTSELQSRFDLVCRLLLEK